MTSDTQSEPTQPRTTLPAWPAIGVIIVALAMGVATVPIAKWILTRNLERMFGGIASLSTLPDRDDRAPAPGFAEIDPLNPANIAPPAPSSRDKAEEKRARFDRLAREVGFVEIAVPVWKWTVRAIAFALAGAGLAGLMRPLRRWRWLAVATLLILAASVLTLGAMWAITRFGGFPPLGAVNYLEVAAVSSAYGWLLLAYLCVRCGRCSTCPTG